MTEFLDPSTMWPPPDPDRIPKRAMTTNTDNAFTRDGDAVSSTDQLHAFRNRQQKDLQRHRIEQPSIRQRSPIHERYATRKPNEEQEQALNVGAATMTDGEEAWRNLEGDRLEDFGVDEAVEFYDEDDVPLAVLLSRRRRVEPS